MTTWEEAAAAYIAEIDKTIPADATIKERKRALREARPYAYRETSWGRKTWQRAQKKYLNQFIKADFQVPEKHLTPLERMMAKARNDAQR